MKEQTFKVECNLKLGRVSLHSLTDILWSIESGRLGEIFGEGEGGLKHH